MNVSTATKSLQARYRRNEHEKVCNGNVKLIFCQCQTTFTDKTSTSKAHRSTTLEERI